MDQKVVEATGLSLAQELSDFFAGLTWNDLPPPVIERAKLQILDGLGTALAANQYDFATDALAGVFALGGKGECTVIGQPHKLNARDAALANGLLVHGLDFDDTHLESIIHATTASLPAALALGEQRDANGRDFLLAYIAGMETAIRVGLVANGAFHHTGFHATAIASHFSSAVVAGKLLGLSSAGMTSAQGIAASTASGVQVFLEEGAWTKRLHPGWGASAGITAAVLAANQFKGPLRPYEGRFGLLDTHLQGHLPDARPQALTADLGARWHLVDTAIKPYPVCHFIHGCADAAIALSSQVDIDEIEHVEALLPEPTLPIVAEPRTAKIRPTTDYEAKFSTQFVVATCLTLGRFGLAELSDAAFSDPQLLALSEKVHCIVDPNTTFPAYFSGGLNIRLRNGKTVSKHVSVNSGAGERALDLAGVTRKFMACASLSISHEQANQIRDVVLNLENASARDLGRALTAS